MYFIAIFLFCAVFVCIMKTLRRKTSTLEESFMANRWHAFEVCTYITMTNTFITNKRLLRWCVPISIKDWSIGQSLKRFHGGTHFVIIFCILPTHCTPLPHLNLKLHTHTQTQISELNNENKNKKLTWTWYIFEWARFFNSILNNMFLREHYSSNQCDFHHFRQIKIGYAFCKIKWTSEIENESDKSFCS